MRAPATSSTHPHLHAHLRISNSCPSRCSSSRHKAVHAASIARQAVDAPPDAREETWAHDTGDSVLVIGAGIAGLAAAAALHKVGIPVTVIEREAGLRREGSAIGIWPNAFRALDALGLAQPLRDAHPLFDRIELCREDGSLLRPILLDECKGGPHEFRGVYRGGLLRTLGSGVPAERVHYGCAVESLRQDEGGVTVALEDGRELRSPLVVGADGVRSRVAKMLGLPDANYAGYIAYRGVATFNDGLPMREGSVRMLWGAGVRAGLYPLSDTEVYWFTTANAPEGSQLSEPEACRADALASVADWSSEIRDAIQNTPLDRITRSRITDRWSMPGKPYGQGRITMVGDAAQPMTPNLGQGGCVALEDAVELARALRGATRGSGAGSVSGGVRALPKSVVEDALRGFERARTMRKLKVSVRSHLIGALTQIPARPVVEARNFMVEKFLPVANFLDHTSYDCGTL